MDKRIKAIQELKALQNIQRYFEAKANMAIGDGKMKMLSWARACGDALELLKEQEPRVLTLEEVTGGGECYVEYRNGGYGYCDCYISDDAETINIYRPLKIDYYADPELYKKTWRCWDRQPTDEQRKAVKWDG